MLNHNISDYGQLQMYWRNQMKAALPKNRSVVFWRNDAQNIKFDANDIVHYWGSTADISKSIFIFIFHSTRKYNLKNHSLTI